MKKSVCCLLIISMVFIVSACSGNSGENEIAKAINEEEIKEITATTRMTVEPQKITLDESEWSDLLDKFNSYSLKKLNVEESGGGWDYYFRIVQNDDSVISVSFSHSDSIGGIVYINDDMYKVENYDSEDFSYLFE
ncbi:MAG: hypothetical protein ACOYJO_05700 [Eubacterium sp.]|jgi:hypothetical protein